MVWFIYVRSYWLEWLFFRMHYADSPLLYKLSGFGLWYISYVWIWQIINIASRTFAYDILPGLKVFETFYELMKKLRKHAWVYHLIVIVYTSRYILDFYNITDIPVKIFGSS